MDWADEKAREWLDVVFGPQPTFYHPSVVDSLAALLREQKAGYANAEMGNAELCAMERDRVLAEVRRVVQKVYDKPSGPAAMEREILARLEKL